MSGVTSASELSTNEAKTAALTPTGTAGQKPIPPEQSQDLTPTQMQGVPSGPDRHSMGELQAMFDVRNWAVYAFILVLIALPIWALSNGDDAVRQQTWLLLAIAYVLVVVAIVAIRIYIRLGELIEAGSARSALTAERLERPSLRPPAYAPPSVYAPHAEYDPPPPPRWRGPAR